MKILSGRFSFSFMGWRTMLCSAPYGPRTSGAQGMIRDCERPVPSMISFIRWLITSP